MPRVFKRSWKDKLTGKSRKSKKYYGYCHDADGIRRRMVLCSDKAASEALLHELHTKAERQQAGLVDPFDEHRKRPLREHLAEFAQTLRDKGNTEDHCRTVENRAAAVLDGCRFRFIVDLSASRVLSYLADIKRSGRSQQTVNHYLRAVKQFSRWMVKDHRSDDDRLVHLSGGNVKTDRRIERRELTDDELRELLSAAKAGPVRFRLTGWQRFTLYATAVGTGLRAKELGSLTPGHFDLDTSPATVHVEAENEKARRGDTLPLPSDLVELLRPWIETIPRDEHLWPGSWAKNKAASRFIQPDLEQAGIDYRTEDGQADFHALRHTYLSRLGRSGVPAKVMQRLARHSSVELTIGRYTHANLFDLGAAVDRLPVLPIGSDSPDEPTATTSLRATGTDDANGRNRKPAAASREPRHRGLRGQIEKSDAAPEPVRPIDGRANSPKSMPARELRSGPASECAGLENQCTFTGTVGSNPTLSALSPVINDTQKDAICRDSNGSRAVVA